MPTCGFWAKKEIVWHDLKNLLYFFVYPFLRVLQIKCSLNVPMGHGIMVNMSMGNCWKLILCKVWLIGVLNRDD